MSSDAFAEHLGKTEFYSSNLLAVEGFTKRSLTLFAFLTTYLPLPERKKFVCTPCYEISEEEIFRFSVN